MTLTRKEILNEPPGIQLDQWVSIHVMGYEIKKEYIWDQSFYEFYYREGIKYENVHYPDEWQPSKYIDAAWIVVEKMRILGFNLNIYVHQSGYTIVYPSTASGLAAEEVMCKTTPDAICKAALLAVLNL